MHRNSKEKYCSKCIITIFNRFQYYIKHSTVLGVIFVENHVASLEKKYVKMFLHKHMFIVVIGMSMISLAGGVKLYIFCIVCKAWTHF